MDFNFRSVAVEVDRTVEFTQLAPRISDGINASENLFDLSLSQALGTAPKTAKFDFASSKLGKVLAFDLVIVFY